jgi:hypothetical protein
MMALPRVYKVNKLAETESVYTDIGLEKAPGWNRLPEPSRESLLGVGESLESLEWEIRPPNLDVAYKIEWDWW